MNKYPILKFLILSSYLFMIVNCNYLINAAIDDIANKLLSSITNISYQLHSSDTHQTMDCLKVSYQYDTSIFGIFHTSNTTTGYSQLFYAELDNNTGLWKNTIKLSQRGSQGTVTRVYSYQKPLGFFIGYQLQNKNNGNRLAIRYYENQDHIKINNFLYQYQLLPIVSGKTMRNVGTPSLQQIQLIRNQSQAKFNQYKINIKFHYCPDGSHDYPGYGAVNIRPLRDFVDGSGKWIGGCYQNYNDWNGVVDTQAQNILRGVGCNGKIGQRDYFIVAGQKYYLYQCNTNASFDWSSWKIALYSPTQNQARMLPLKLGGDTDIANPHISLKQKSANNYKFVATFFLPSQGIKPDVIAKPGESFVEIGFSYP